MMWGNCGNHSLNGPSFEATCRFDTPCEVLHTALLSVGTRKRGLRAAPRPTGARGPPACGRAEPASISWVVVIRLSLKEPMFFNIFLRKAPKITWKAPKMEYIKPSPIATNSKQYETPRTQRGQRDELQPRAGAGCLSLRAFAVQLLPAVRVLKCLRGLGCPSRQPQLGSGHFTKACKTL